ncbi:MAG: ribonuclease R [Kofleriaceae bacterium]|nr:ribonuclease R [Kofleriaceae bacterium]
MTFDKEQVLSILGQASSDGLKVGALLDELELSRLEQRRMRRFLEGLIEEKYVEKVARGTYALAPGAKGKLRRAAKRASLSSSSRPQNQSVTSKSVSSRTGGRNTASLRTKMPDAGSPLCEGRIRVHPAGYGFVVRDDGQVDVFVPAKYRGAALDGDKVSLYTWEGYKGTEGRVEEVLARGRAKITGVLEKSGASLFVVPDDPRIATDFGRVGIEGGPGQAKLGECVVVDITHYPSDVDNHMAGRISKVLGPPDDPRTEIQKIIICADLPYEMPEEALAQAETIHQTLQPEDFADRIDLRDRDFLTIDPETARDFDDAICIEDGPLGGPRVWVAVADVSHYVQPGDALDNEAQIRGVSVYLPDQVIPMLPMKISAGICSLNPHVDRCAMVVRMDYDSSLHLQDTGFAAAVIKSSDRLDYPGVAAALSGDFRGSRESYRKWEGHLHRLHALAQTLRQRRRARGTLELDIPEAKVVLDADDPLLVRDVVRSKGTEGVKEAYQLVEEFMISANEAVGAFFTSRGLDALWRIHAPPKESRVEELAELLGAFGIRVDIDEAMTPIGMRKVLEQVNKLPSGQALSFLVLRSLTQAVYHTENVGHFGLASKEYIHFTSPIRRYPDLQVHRLIKMQLHKEGQASAGGGRWKRPNREELQELAAMCSGHERRAVEAEREAVAMYRAYLMRQHVGEEFSGRISGVTHFGAFIEIDEPFVEGLLKVEALGDDFFDFDPVMMQLTGRRTGFTLSLGDSIEVEVLNVSVALRRIELGLVGGKRGTDVADRRSKSPRRRYATPPDQKPSRSRSRPPAGEKKRGKKKPESASTTRKPSKKKAPGRISHKGPKTLGKKKPKAKAKSKRPRRKK